MIMNDDPKVQVASGFSQLYLMQKIRFMPARYWNLEYSFHYSAISDAPRYDRLCLDENNDGELDYAEWYYGPQKWMMNRLGILYGRSTKLFDRMSMLAAFQNYEESRHDRKFNKTSLRNQVEKVNAGSLNLNFDKTINPKATVYYGAEAVINRINSNGQPGEYRNK